LGLLALACVGSLASARRPKRGVRLVDTIRLEEMVRWQGPSAFLDIGKEELLLDFTWRPKHAQGRDEVWEPSLVLWDYERRQAIREISLKDWLNWEKKVPQQLQGYGPLKFQGNGTRIVALQVPWVVLIDVAKGVEIRRALPSESYLRQDSPGRASWWGDIRIAGLDINPQDDSVAVVYNVGKDTHVYVYDSQLEMQIASWKLPRSVSGLCWSPDGRKLAVLFFGRYDENREIISMHTTDSSHEPDVWIVDPHSGAPLLKFWTGSNQDQIAFSKDGSLIYVINDFYYDSRAHKGAIRVFSAVTGELVQTISAGRRAVHSIFKLSPDGNLIAADASTDVPRGLHMERIWMQKIARVTLIDAQTGDLLFEHHERTETEKSNPLRMAFSPDSRFLFVRFPRGYKYPYQHIEVYSIDGINETKQ
jgi:WD40 repeat protein